MSTRQEQALSEQGWERRFFASPDRLDECLEIYVRLGFEVHVQTLEPSAFGDECNACSASLCASHVLIYTRVPKGPL